MYQLCRGSQQDFEQIRDFANYVFSQSDRPHDFKKLLPKLYEDDQSFAEYHYLIKENDVIKAMVCVIPLVIQTADQRLKAGCIGTVSVHPYSRGKGYMKILMNTILEELKRDGYDLAFLGGQRQRYEYFGFEPSGIQGLYTLTRTNIHHCCKGEAVCDIKLIPFEQTDQWTEEAFLLYQQQKVRVLREKKEFVSILKSWNSLPYYILDQGGFAGYLTVQTGGLISEILLKDNHTLKRLLKPLSDLTGLDRLSVITALYETEKNQILSKIAEDCILQVSHNYCIFNWKKTLFTFLNLKSIYSELEEGTLILGIDDENLRITVAVNNKVSIEETIQKADIQLTKLEAAAILMSPAGFTLESGIMKNLNKHKRLCLHTWFPLPLYTALTDCC